MGSLQLGHIAQENTMPKLRHTFPDLAAMFYFRAVRPLLKQLHLNTLKALQPALDYYRVGRTVNDAYTDSSPLFFQAAKQRFKTALQEAETKTKFSTKTIEKAANNSYKNTLNVTKGNLARQKIPIHPDPQHRAQYIQQNVELIKSIPQRSFSTLARMIDQHIEANATVETLAKAIESRYHVSESQAKLIAVDQTQKLHSQLSRDAYQDAGVTQAYWRSLEDDRVRESHQEANGKLFDLNVGLLVDGETTFPGMPVNCRCFSEPILQKVSRK